MSNTYITYQGNGSQTDFAIPFDFVERTDVVVERTNGGTAFTFINDNLIKLSTPLLVGQALVVRRVTDVDEPAAEFRNGAVTTAEMLNASFEQVLYAVQESRDIVERSLYLNPFNQWDAKGYPIINVGAPTMSGYAATKGYVDNAIAAALENVEGGGGLDPRLGDDEDEITVDVTSRFNSPIIANAAVAFNGYLYSTNGLSVSGDAAFSGHVTIGGDVLEVNTPALLAEGVTITGEATANGSPIVTQANRYSMGGFPDPRLGNTTDPNNKIALITGGRLGTADFAESLRIRSKNATDALGENLGPAMYFGIGTLGELGFDQFKDAGNRFYGGGKLLRTRHRSDPNLATSDPLSALAFYRDGATKMYWDFISEYGSAPDISLRVGGTPVLTEATGIKKWTYTPTVNANGASALDITGIPAGAEEIILYMNGVSGTANNNLLIQIYDQAGALVTSNYFYYNSSLGSTISGGGGSGVSSIVLVQSANAAQFHSGTISIQKSYTDSSWFVRGDIWESSARTVNAFGSTGTATQVTGIRLSLSSGTFDSGGFRVAYR